MSKQLNGIFRAWMKVKQQDEMAPPIIWGHCIVHLSHPEFSGNVLHTSGVVAIKECKTFLVDRKSTRLNSSHSQQSRMPSSA